jgi:hypothetical protein
MGKSQGRPASVHLDGPGLKVLDRKQRWYGPGYCGICGTHNILPIAVRFYDADDGWQMGVLCAGCGAECASRGPKPSDYAMRSGAIREIEHAEAIDLLAELGDLDGAFGDAEDLLDSL